MINRHPVFNVTPLTHPEQCMWCGCWIDRIDGFLDAYNEPYHVECYQNKLENQEPPDEYEGDGVFADNH